MYKCISVTLLFIATIFIQGCSEILEPVMLKGILKNDTQSPQEEFEINIDTLTFKKARQANKDPYFRQLMLTGSGENAKVLDEVDLLSSKIPNQIQSDVKLGTGDVIIFNMIQEFKNEMINLPKMLKNAEYRLGVGDQLTFVQVTDKTTIALSEASSISPTGVEKVIKTSGIVGSNGSILLLGVGNIKAINRTLVDVQKEVRNVLIRNGLTPNFQLEITKFDSQKAFITLNGKSGNILSINNIPLTLQEVALANAVEKDDEKTALISLTRDKKTYKFTAEQLFSDKTPDVFIKNKDIISLIKNPNPTTTITTSVGSKGNILLPIVGKINVINQTIDDVYKKIYNILLDKGLVPNFQIELKTPVSRNVFLIRKNVKSVVVPLFNYQMSLKNVILKNNSFQATSNGLFIINLKRGKKIFRLTLDKLLDPETPAIWLHDKDQIEIEFLQYKPGQVYALNGEGNASILNIDPSRRETLASIIFADNGVLNNLKAKRSEIYLLRGRNPAVAYHLDARDVSRILVAAKIELRPNDIIYTADRPIISFRRALEEIEPLRILLRNIESGDYP
jgi:protein involved in polysaccharide export with SLBB domain